MLKLYGFPLSQPTRSVLMLLKESKTPYSFVLIDALKGDNRKNPQFKQDFPGNAVVPAIDDNGLKLMESGAILTHLCETRKLDKFYPTNDASVRAHVNCWMHWHHTNTRNSTTGILRNHLFKQMPDREANLARGTKAFTQGLKHMELHLGKTKFLAAGSNNATIADMLLLCEIDQLMPEAFNLYDFKPFPNILRWVGDCRQDIKSYQEVYDPVVEISKKYV